MSQYPPVMSPPANFTPRHTSYYHWRLLENQGASETHFYVLITVKNHVERVHWRVGFEFICVLWLTQRFRCFIVEPDFDNTGNFSMLIIHLDSKVSGMHLMGIVGTSRISHHLTFDRSINPFQEFYVNRYRDHPQRTRLGSNLAQKEAVCPSGMFPTEYKFA